MTKEITKTETAIAVQSPIELMTLALSKNMEVDKLEKMLELQERYEKNEAKKAYTDAMASFKANPPKILKDMNVSYKQTSYNHASLGNVTQSINKALAEHGFSSSWKTNQENNITVTCSITHKAGHSESTSLSAPPDSSGSKNTIQAIGSTVTYLQRYTLLALTGLATHEDDDAQKAGMEFITPEQVKTITDIINTKCLDVNEVLRFAGSETIDTIQGNKYKPLISKLKMPVVQK
ncbi:MAG: ERF family protein [Candidatus Peribacteraceae bacterium]|nr:ERF family protein [Candidatus Peribacteraceae bacterium]